MGGWFGGHGHGVGGGRACWPRSNPAAIQQQSIHVVYPCCSAGGASRGLAPPVPPLPPSHTDPWPRHQQPHQEGTPACSPSTSPRLPTAHPHPPTHPVLALPQPAVASQPAAISQPGGRWQARCASSPGTRTSRSTFEQLRMWVSRQRSPGATLRSSRWCSASEHTSAAAGSGGGGGGGGWGGEGEEAR